MVGDGGGPTPASRSARWNAAPERRRGRTIHVATIIPQATMASASATRPSARRRRRRRRAPFPSSKNGSRTRRMADPVDPPRHCASTVRSGPIPAGRANSQVPTRAPAVQDRPEAQRRPIGVVRSTSTGLGPAAVQVGGGVGLDPPPTGSVATAFPGGTVGRGVAPPGSRAASASGSAARGRTAAARRRSRSAGCSGPGFGCPSHRAGASACATARRTPRGAVADAARKQVPVRAIGRGARPTRADRRSGRMEVDGESAVLLPAGRAGVDRAADRGDRAAPDRQPPRHARVRLGPGGRLKPSATKWSDGKAAELRGRHRRAHRRDRRRPWRAYRWRHPAVPVRQEVVRLVAAGGEVVVDPDRVVAGGQPLDGEPERDDAALRVLGVVAVEVAVLPGHVLGGPLVEIDAGARRVTSRTTRSARQEGEEARR